MEAYELSLIHIQMCIRDRYGNDPTNNAIYFWNPDIATCNWIKTLNPYMRIGNHVFAKQLKIYTSNTNKGAFAPLFFC